MLNITCIMGRLSADPELRHTQSQTPVTTFRVAVDRDYKPKDGEKVTDWIDCVAWRSTGEFICRNFHKGDLIIIKGSIQTRSYTDKNGNKRTATEICVEQAYYGQSKGTGSRPLVSDVPPVFAASDDFEEILGDDETPF